MICKFTAQSHNNLFPMVILYIFVYSSNLSGL